MLYDKNGVSAITQAKQHVQQPSMICRMKTHAGLVQCIGNSNEAHAQLGGQTGSLGFPAAQCPVRSAEGKVAQSHLAKITQTPPQAYDSIGNDLEFR